MKLTRVLAKVGVGLAGLGVTAAVLTGLTKGGQDLGTALPGKSKPNSVIARAQAPGGGSLQKALDAAFARADAKPGHWEVTGDPVHFPNSDVEIGPDTIEVFARQSNQAIEWYVKAETAKKQAKNADALADGVSSDGAREVLENTAEALEAVAKRDLKIASRPDSAVSAVVTSEAENYPNHDLIVWSSPNAHQRNLASNNLRRATQEAIQDQGLRWVP